MNKKHKSTDQESEETPASSIKLPDDSQSVTKEDFEKLQLEFSKLQELAGKLEDQLKRALADYQNLEKRVTESRLELSKWATGELIRKILPVVSNLEKVVELGRPVLSEQNESKEWFRGVEMAVKQLQGVLKDEGLHEIETGSQFDPALHEAVDTEEGEDNKILKVLEKGYTLHGKIVKPATVVVGRKN